MPHPVPVKPQQHSSKLPQKNLQLPWASLLVAQGFALEKIKILHCNKVWITVVNNTLL
jgi:hypothetical protein